MEAWVEKENLQPKYKLVAWGLMAMRGSGSVEELGVGEKAV